MKVELKKCRVEYLDKKTGENKKITQFRLYFKDNEYIVVKNAFQNDYNTLKYLSDDDLSDLND